MRRQELVVGYDLHPPSQYRLTRTKKREKEVNPIETPRLPRAPGLLQIFVEPPSLPGTPLPRRWTTERRCRSWCKGSGSRGIDYDDNDGDDYDDGDSDNDAGDSDDTEDEEDGHYGDDESMNVDGGRRW